MRRFFSYPFPMRKKLSISKDKEFIEDPELTEALSLSGIPPRIHRFIQELFQRPNISHSGAATPPSHLMKTFMGRLIRCIIEVGSPKYYYNCIEISRAVRSEVKDLIEQRLRRDKLYRGEGEKFMKYAGASFAARGNSSRRKNKHRRDTE